MTPPALELQEVYSRREGTTIADNLNLVIESGEVVCLLGPSGSGKSSLLRLLLGLSIPERGVIRIGGQTASSGNKLRLTPECRNLGMVFQHLALWPHLNVRENLEFVLRAAPIARHKRPVLITAILKQMALGQYEKHKPSQLSGGEQQRVALARALIATPKALLLDEPLSHLDVVLKLELLQLLKESLRATKTAALYVTHDPQEALLLSNRWLVLEKGRLIQDDTPAQLQAYPASLFVQQLVKNLHF